METRGLQSYVLQLNSDTPTPGGGSAAAYVASMSVALVNMALKISIKRKKFLENSQEVQTFVHQQIAFFDQEVIDLLAFMQQDEQAFSAFLTAYQQKESNLQPYLLACLLVPAQLAKRVLTLVEIYHQVAPFIVASIKGDLKMGYFFARAVLQGCLDNITINLEGITDLQLKADSLQLIQHIITTIQNLE